MAKHVGVKLSEDLLELLEKGTTVAVLATFSEKGVPNTTPIQCMYPKGVESILMTIHKNHTGYQNMVWQKKVMLSFMDSENIAYSILGRAGVVKAPSHVHPLMNVVRIDIIDIKSDRSVLTRITSGVKWEYASWEAEEFSKALLQELKDLSRAL